jgi:hypothetical protein
MRTRLSVTLYVHCLSFFLQQCRNLNRLPRLLLLLRIMTIISCNVEVAHIYRHLLIWRKIIKENRSNVATNFGPSGFGLFTVSSPERDIDVCFYSVLCSPV